MHTFEGLGRVLAILGEIGGLIVIGAIVLFIVGCVWAIMDDRPDNITGI